MTNDEIEKLAHRTCFRYAHAESEDFRQYTFSKLTLRQFAEEIKRQTIEEVQATLKWEADAVAGSASDTRRFDWTTSGMKQSDSGAWVLASTAASKEGE